MAVFKKSLFIVFAFVLAFASFIFIPQNKIQTTYATSEPTYDNTYTYNGEVDSAVNGLGDYAISNIEYLDLGGTFLVHLAFDTSKITSDYVFFSYYSNGDNKTWRYVSFGLNSVSYLVDLNFCVISRSSSSAMTFVRSNKQVKVSLKPNTGIFDFYFSQNVFNFSKWNVFSLTTPLSYNGVENVVYQKYDWQTSLNSIVDMNSETVFSQYVNFSLASDFDSINYPLSADGNVNGTYNNHQYSFRYVLYENLQMLENGSAIDSHMYNFGSSLLGGSYLPTDNVSVAEGNRFGYDITSINTKSGYNFGYINYFNFSWRPGYFETGTPTQSGFSIIENSVNISRFYFSIKKPIHRINNTLVIYNYDYIDFLDNVSSVSYSLSKGNDLYIIDYQGNVPNTKYIYVYNNEIQNITFDEYIYLYMTFNNPVFLVNSGRIWLDLGFDFNFTYYTEPLVLNDGSYNYTFNKPAYKDARIGFSIVPPQLHIPIEAWAYNIVIFFCFYCPIISDILGLLKINYFINSLMTVFTMFVGSAIGQFVNACICFLLFWGIMKGLMPSMGGAFSSGAKQIINSINVIKEESKRHIPKKAEFKVKKYGMLKTSQRRKLRSRFNGYKKGTRKSVVNKHGYNQRVYTKKDFDSHYSNIDLDNV